MQAFYWTLAKSTKRLNSVIRGNLHAEEKAEEMAVAVVDRIVRKCHEIERAYRQGICGERELRSLESCTRNLQRIEHFLSPNTLEDLRRSLDGLRTHISGGTDLAETGGFSVHRIHSGEII